MSEATRDGYGRGLVKLGEMNKDVVALDADLAESTKSGKFADKFPERFFEMGVSEADMIGTAAGLACCNKIAFASTFAMFATGRVFDQIYDSVAYPNLDVKIVGSHGGLATGEDGVSHQAITDIALMRSIPNMKVIVPADSIEAEKATIALADIEGPVYMRTGRAKTDAIFDENYEFKFGKGVVLKEGKDVAILATGSLVIEAKKAAELLEKENINAYVVNIHTIKPIDKDLIIKLAKETKGIVTVEDHNIIGGLGGAVSEVLSQNSPAKVEMIGVKDCFAESGCQCDLYNKYGLTAEEIVNAAKRLL
ncbi:MAG: transketolase family protein [bacterium]|nr:transketolase family protein [bacterium]